MSTRLLQRSVFLTLAAASALPALAGDMYLAALPELTGIFDAPAWAVQVTFTGYLVMVGLTQLVVGPVTDAYGRRRSLLLGLALFVIGSVLAAVASTLWILIVARILQGAGGGTALVVANSSVRDYASGADASRMYAVLMTIASVAPIVAPSVGGVLSGLIGWRSVFVLLAVVGLVVFRMGIALRESHPEELRSPLSVRRVCEVYLRLLRTRDFIVPAATLSLMMASLFGYLGGAPYVYRVEFEVTAELFGLFFAITGTAVLVGTAVSGLLLRVAGDALTLLLGLVIDVAGVALLVLTLMSGFPVVFLVGAATLMLFGLGVCEPVLLSLSMNAVDRDLGTASAVVGACVLILGSLSATVVGYAGESDAMLWGIGLAVLTVAAGTCASLVIARQR